MYEEREKARHVGLEKVHNLSRSTLVYWHVGNRCNYECSYCPEHLHDGSSGWPDVDAVKATIDQLYRHYTQQLKRPLAFNFSGGEPTLYPHFIEVSKFAKTLSSDIAITMVSNGSRTERFWNRLLPYFDGTILSFHVEFVDIAHFEKICRLLWQHKKLIRIHCNMHLERWEECKSMYLRLLSRFMSSRTKRLSSEEKLSLPKPPRSIAAG